MEIIEVSPVEIKSLWPNIHFDRVSGKSVSKYLFYTWNGKHAQSEKRGLNKKNKKTNLSWSDFVSKVCSYKYNILFFSRHLNIIKCYFTAKKLLFPKKVDISNGKPKPSGKDSYLLLVVQWKQSRYSVIISILIMLWN